MCVYTNIISLDTKSIYNKINIWKSDQEKLTLFNSFEEGKPFKVIYFAPNIVTLSLVKVIVDNRLSIL